MFEQIIDSLKGERDKIDKAISALTLVNSNGSPKRKQRTMSAAARARISKAMRANWRKRKAA